MKKGMFKTDKRFLGLLRESLAILAAILVAFALDAWWEERREYSQMLDALDAVSVEIERNIALLDEAIAHNQVQAQRGFAVARLTPDDIPELPMEQVAELSNVPNYNLVRLQLGAVTAFIEGGYLAVVPDRALRAEIAAIPRVQEEIDEEMSAVLSAQEKMEATMTANLTVEEMLRMMENPARAGTGLLNSIATNDDARKDVVFRSFFLGQLYAVELKEARQILETTKAHVDAFSE